MPTTQQPPTPAPFYKDRMDLIQLVNAKAVAMARSLNPDYKDEGFLKALLQLLVQRRLYLVSDKAAFSELWKEIRQNDTLTDFLVSLTTELAFLLLHTNFSYSDLISDYAKASSALTRDWARVTCNTGWVSSGGSAARAERIDARAMDNDLLERLPDEDEIATLYYGNPWYVTLLLLKSSGFAESLASTTTSTQA